MTGGTPQRDTGTGELRHVVSLFATRGAVSGIAPLGSGLINDTYRVTTAEASTPDYVLQRVNSQVFPDVGMVMRNIGAVTRHIRRKLEESGADDIDRKVLTFVPLRDDADRLYTEQGGEYWRVAKLIPRAVTKQAVNPESSRAAGLAFGSFQSMLSDLPVPLGETIKDFHNMEFRLRQLREAVDEDAAGRAGEPRVRALLGEIEARAREMCKAERMGREGTLPKRVCHCDTKVNNMLFDEQDRVLCVIDLDTVMPNFIFSDYGDFLRTGANLVAEDCPDMERVGFRMDIFKAFTEGYLRGAGSFLLPVEVENLPYAAALFPYMQCVRFLWDYLRGDRYWKCQYPAHNLTRADNQLHLLLSVESHLPAMREFIGSRL